MHQFERNILNNIEEIDGIVLACREEMMRQAGNDRLCLQMEKEYKGIKNIKRKR